MKNVPLFSVTQAAHHAAVVADLECLTTVNDAIVDAITAGAIYPGSKVHHSRKNFSVPLQTWLQERFTNAGWRLHFNVGNDVRPGTTIYIYGAEAKYPPHNPQPDEECRERSSSRSWFQDSPLGCFLKSFLKTHPRH